MKILYLTIWNFDKGTSDGVVKKILQQVNTLKKQGYEVDYTSYFDNEKSIYLNSNEETILLGKVKFVKGIELQCIIKKYLKGKVYDWIYVRRMGRIDPWGEAILKLLYEQNSKILYELPTYPYEMLSKDIASKIDIEIDKIYRRRLKKYVERIITYSQHRYIFEIPTINIMNGIDVDGIEIIKNEKRDAKIHLLAVALMQPSHGYERIIKGMARYVERGGNKIHIHFVGEGPEKCSYQKLVEELGLSDKIEFKTFLSGKELDEMYELADMTLIDFGAYKQGIHLTSALKSRESLAKGLPMITACKIDICEMVPFEYILEFSNDDSDIDMFEVENFYNKIMRGKNKTEIAEEIRMYAKQNVDMSKTMQPVIDYLNGV